MKKKIFVAQVVDANNNNPQALNVKAMLSRFHAEDIEWVIPHYDEPDPLVAANPNVTLKKLWRRRFWQWHKALLYQLPVDAIFYPGAYWFDYLALRFRAVSGRKVPIITTLEGLVGNTERERILTEWAGHPVYCQHLPDSLLRHIDHVHSMADQIIAISPFLARMGRRLYGDKFSVLPLGVDSRTFFPGKAEDHQRFKVMGAGRIYGNKRPGLFLDIAAQFPQADFVWFGEGELREHLLSEKVRRGLENVSYPGAVANDHLAEEMRRSDLFVMPSSSEGVPKVTQEAAACGLPVIIFGFYEAPSVIDGENGYVVWNDDELFAKISELMNDPEQAQSMGVCGAEMAKGWVWDKVAARWEAKLLEILNRQ